MSPTLAELLLSRATVTVNLELDPNIAIGILALAAEGRMMRLDAEIDAALSRWRAEDSDYLRCVCQ